MFQQLRVTNHESRTTKPSVLFVCVANSCRSQMAEAIAKSLTNGRWDVWSAGSNPSGQVHPIAIELMKEMGLGLGGHQSKGVDQVPQRQWDYVVTMGCGDRCPAVAARTRLDWQVPDPVGLSLEEARAIRDQLTRQVRELVSREQRE